MSNVFEVLKRMGGVVVEDGVTYVTHPNPPVGDNSQKIATTAWVRDITDGLEASISDVSASVSGGMFPKVQALNSSNVPSGGTWWCYGVKWNSMDGLSCYNYSKAGGSYLGSGFNVTNALCINIA